MANRSKMKVIGKQELVKQVAMETKLSQKAASAFLDSTVKLVSESLQRGEEVRIIGFGSWKVRQSKARTMKNPRTQESLQVPAKKRVTFYAGKGLAESLNPGGSPTKLVNSPATPNAQSKSKA